MNARRPRREEDEDGSESEEDAAVHDVNKDKEIQYKRRTQCRVLRYRSYDVEDVVNHKRELVLLYVPFRNEAVDVLDRNKK